MVQRNRTDQAPAVGAIGLGNMGAPIARSISRAGLDLIVFDSDPTISQQFADERIDVAQSLDDFSACDLVAVIVANDEQLLDVTAKLAEILAAGSAVIIHSTVLPATVLAVGEKLAAKQIAVIDAPVSGGAWAAEEAQLTIMVGGNSDDIDDCTPELAAIGTYERVGDLGAGEVIKILNNLMYAACWAISYECLHIGRRLGVSESLLRSIAGSSSGQSWALNSVDQLDDVIQNHQAAANPAALANLVSKDAWLALRLARENDLHLPLVATVAESMPGAIQRRLEDLQAREKKPDSIGR